MNYLKRYGGLFLLLVSIALLLLSRSWNPPTPPSLVTTTTQTTTLDVSETNNSSSQTTWRYVFVELKGAVRFPGVYRVMEGTRLYEVIEKAGGLKATANTEQLNQTLFVTDMMVITIEEKVTITTTTTTTYFGTTTQTIPTTSPSMKVNVTLFGEVNTPGSYEVQAGISLQSLVQLAGGFSQRADLSNLDLTRTIWENQSITIPSLPQAELVNINRANLEELSTLPGIGLILGQRIIDYRAQNGPFEAIEEIMNVSGIKQAIYEKIRDLITI